MSTAIATALPAPIPFESFREFHGEHTQLLREYHSDGANDEMTAAISSLICRGAALGRILAEDSERDAAQQMLDHWATLLYRIGDQAPDAALAEFEPAALPSLEDEDCPYLGLNAFGRESHNCFFGRERLLVECAQLLANRPVLAVLGQSGSGKSSVVSGGLLPALTDGEFSELPQSREWLQIGPIMPGSEPLESLARALVAAGISNVDTTTEAQVLKANPERLRELLASSSGVLIAVDQFEELFTLCEEESARTAFLELLLTFLQPFGEHRLVLTMRSEFEPWVARYRTFHSHFIAGQVRVGAMEPADLRRAIEAPAKRAGLQFQAGVVDALLRDTAGEPAALPMLQFTLLKLWERRERNRVTLRAYEELGGARLALARCADAFYQDLSIEEQGTARRVLLRMVRVSDAFELHSQRVKRASLKATGEDTNRLNRVVDALIAAHLVRPTGEGTADAQIEVAHEALIRNWPTLLEWIQKHRTDLLTRRRMNEYAAEWVRRGRGETGLLDAELMAEAERWTKSNAAREFGYHEALKELMDASAAKLLAEQLRQQEEREAREAEVRRRDRKTRRLLRAKELRQDRDRIRRKVFWSAILGVAVIVAVTCYIFSLGSLQRKQRELDAKAAEIETKNRKVQELGTELDKVSAEQKVQEVEAQRKIDEQQKLLTKRGDDLALKEGALATALEELSRKQTEIEDTRKAVEEQKQTVAALTTRYDPAASQPIRRGDLTVEYFPRPSDQAKVETVLEKLKFPKKKRESGFPEVPTNVLTYGTKVNIEDVKTLAIELVRAGVELRAINRIWTGRRKEALVQLSGYVTVTNSPILTEEQIRQMDDTVGPDVTKPAPITSEKAVVTLLLANSGQVQSASAAENVLKDLRYQIDEVRDVTGWGYVPDTTEVRYFRFPQDKAEADFIASLLRPFDSRVRSSFVVDKEAAKRKEPKFEIWFSRKAFADAGAKSVPVVARIYLEAGPKSVERAKKLKQQLEQRGFWVRVEPLEASPGRDSQISYYSQYPEDVEEAKKLIGILKQLGVENVQSEPRTIEGPTSARPRHFDVKLP